MALLIVLVVPEFITQLKELISQLPNYLSKVKDFISGLFNRFDTDALDIATILCKIQKEFDIKFTREQKSDIKTIKDIIKGVK